MESEETRRGKSQAVIPADTEVEGQIKTAANIQIDGKLNGDLSCAGDAVIGNSASINGNMTVNSVVVSGRINGNITAKDRIELKATARIMGDIKAKRLTVEDGVTFVGKSEVSPSGSTAGRTAEQSEAGGSADDVDSVEEKGGTPEETEYDKAAKQNHGVISQKENKKGKAGSLFWKKASVSGLAPGRG